MVFILLESKKNKRLKLSESVDVFPDDVLDEEDETLDSAQDNGLHFDDKITSW